MISSVTASDGDVCTMKEQLAGAHDINPIFID
jgi:hypothetical protein